ncbi:hypothetical protein [uncultured Zobellia sp.]|uniref:hypothetical protein n=1 Tax=uncultured Zobellia sp. TaxID=255433 RepID=UPI0025937BF1|nr:hypothetical protein [uncultured Zobellia sp.]
MTPFSVLAFVFTLLLAAHRSPNVYNQVSSLFGFLVMGVVAILLLIPGMMLAFLNKVLNGEILMGYYGVSLFASLSLISSFFACYFWREYRNVRK